ncbi:MAG: hypothetical protein NTV86_15040 [Planctomycetota bacterium]|nr:hypothetical protein [Planctomycetota bacterium]
MAEQMTSTERIGAALKGQPVDRIPWSPFLAYVWEHFPKEIQDLGQVEFHNRIGGDPLWRGAPCPVRAETDPRVRYANHDENGLGVTVVETPVGSLRWGGRASVQGNTTFLVEHPLKKPEDYKVQMWIEEHTKIVYDDQCVVDHMRNYGDIGLSVAMLIPRGKSAYQSLVEHHVGTEELVYAMCDYPETVEALLAVMVARDLEAARLAAGCGAYEYFLTWEDSGTQNYSPDQYARYIGAEIGQWCGILSASGKKYVQHACGHVKALVPLMRSHGTAVIESVCQPPTGNVSMADVRRLGGGEFGIIGGIEPTAFLRRSPEELIPYVEEMIDQASGGPFVLANGDSCPPGVTMEKFKLVGDIVRRTKVRG